MIAPHELKNKSFSRAVRGYNPAEVDEYFDFLIEKYTEAYKKINELEQQIHEISAKYSELSGEEQSIRSTLLKAQKLGEVIVENAKKEAQEKTKDLADRCERIIADAKEKVAAEKENFIRLRKIALDFQHKLYSEYVDHVQMIRDMKLDNLPDNDEIFSEDESFRTALAESMEGPEFDLLIPNEKPVDQTDDTKTEES